VSNIGLGLREWAGGFLGSRDEGADTILAASFEKESVFPGVGRITGNRDFLCADKRNLSRNTRIMRRACVTRTVYGDARLSFESRFLLGQRSGDRTFRIHANLSLAAADHVVSIIRTAASAALKRVIVSGVTTGPKTLWSLTELATRAIYARMLLLSRYPLAALAESSPILNPALGMLFSLPEAVSIAALDVGLPVLSLSRKRTILTLGWRGQNEFKSSR